MNKKSVYATQENIAQIKSKISILDVVESSVKLERRGNAHVGLCPFHSEKSPSFYVWSNTSSYYCFGCQASGDIITFTMESKGLSFIEAIKELADKAGVSLKTQYYEDKSESSTYYSNSELFKATAILSTFYSNFLIHTLKSGTERSEKLLKYLKERRITEDHIRNFKLGLAPSSLTESLKFIEGKVDKNIFFELGIFRRSSKGYEYDLFKDRLIFPVTIDSKKVAGFGGRIIPDYSNSTEKSPKYINSPESKIYKKSEILYGLPQGLESIRKNKVVFITEGYMDVLSMYKSEIKNTVATCGTSLTDSHITRLSQLARTIIIIFDGDKAGRNAASRVFPVLIQSSANVKVIFLPNDKDPDDLSRVYGHKLIDYLYSIKTVNPLESFINIKLEEFSSEGDYDSISTGARINVAKEVFNKVSNIKDSLILSEVRKTVAYKLNLNERLLHGEIEKVTNRTIKSDIEKNNNDIELLPSIDKEIVKSFMVLREKYYLPDDIREDIYRGLSPLTVSFLESFILIVDNLSSSEEQTKDKIKKLLIDLGKDWIELWKQSIKVRSSGNGMEVSKNVLTDCYYKIRVALLKKISQNLSFQLRKAKTHEDQQKYAQERVKIERTLRHLISSRSIYNH